MPQNSNLWQGVNGVNNPCPSGYRLPTEIEFEIEHQSWSSDDGTGAYASPLKFPAAGNRLFSSGALQNVGSSGGYWSSFVTTSNARYLYIGSSNAEFRTFYRAQGYSVRCLKD